MFSYNLKLKLPEITYLRGREITNNKIKLILIFRPRKGKTNRKPKRKENESAPMF